MALQRLRVGLPLRSGGFSRDRMRLRPFGHQASPGRFTKREGDAINPDPSASQRLRFGIGAKRRRLDRQAA